MRTTVAIDDDVLETVRARAQQQKLSVGQVLTDLARQALDAPVEAPRYRNGIRLLSHRSGRPVTMEMVNRLRDELP